jgi:hypothetical protein
MPILAERLLNLAPRLDAAITNNPNPEALLFLSSLAGSPLEILGDLLNIFIKEPIGSPLLLPQKNEGGVEVGESLVRIPWIRRLG